MHKIHRSSYYIRYSIFIIRIEYHRSKLGLSSVRNYEGTFVIAKLPRFRLVLLSRPPRILLLLAASYIGRRRTTRLAANITNSSVVVVPPKCFLEKSSTELELTATHSVTHNFQCELLRPKPKDHSPRFFERTH